MVRKGDVLLLEEAVWHSERHAKGPRDIESGSPRAKVALQEADVGMTGVYWTLQEAEGAMTRGSARHL